jgi:hypothetical protein
MSGQLFDVRIDECSGYTLYGDPVLELEPSALL